jgi:hypothetical protein
LTAPHVEGRKVQADTSSEISSRYQYLCPEFVRLVARASECEESYRMLDQCSVELRKKVEEILQKQTSIDVSATQPDVDDIQISLNTTENESGAVDYSSSTRAKGAKKKGHKSSIGKGLKKKKKKVQPEEPATECNMWDAPTQPGNVLFQVIPAFSFTMVVDLYSASLIVLQRDCNLILILYSTKQIES